MKMGDFRSRIDPKPPLNEETEKENLERAVDRRQRVKTNWSLIITIVDRLIKKLY